MEDNDDHVHSIGHHEMKHMCSHKKAAILKKLTIKNEKGTL